MDKSFQTERLKFNIVKSQDLIDIHELHSLPETDEFNTLGIPDDVKQTRQVLNCWIDLSKKELNPEYTFSIRDIYSYSFIGLIALKCGNPKFKIGEVWYKIHVKYWRKGFGTEALKRILDFGFYELKLHRIEAGCAVKNTGSIKLLEKVGMQKEGQKRKVLPLKNGWSDNFEFAILAEDWNKVTQQTTIKNI